MEIIKKKERKGRDKSELGEVEIIRKKKEGYKRIRKKGIIGKIQETQENENNKEEQERYVQDNYEEQERYVQANKERIGKICTG